MSAAPNVAEHKIKVAMAIDAGSVGLIDKNLPKNFLMDLRGTFNNLHNLGITVIPGNRG